MLTDIVSNVGVLTFPEIVALVVRTSRDRPELESATTAQNQLLLELFAEDSWRNVYAGELGVRPPGAPPLARRARVSLRWWLLTFVTLNRAF